MTIESENYEDYLTDKILCYYCGDKTFINHAQYCKCGRKIKISSDHVLSPNFTMPKEAALHVLDEMRSTVCKTELSDITTQKMFYTLLSVVKSLAI